MLGQNGELAHDHRQLAIAFHVEGEGHLVRAGRLGLRHVLVIERHARVGCLVHLKAVDDVLGRDRLAVMPARFVAKLEGDRGEVRRVGRPFGDQAIGGRGLLQAVGHQAFIDEPEAGRGLALVEDRVQAIEGADIGHAHEAALGGVRVHIVEMLEVGRVFRRADERDGVMALRRVLLRRILARGGDQARDRERQGKERSEEASWRANYA